jgi:flagellar biosynthesis GTPase FlhF
VKLAYSTASAANDGDEIMQDAPSIEAIMASNVEASEGVVDGSLSCDLSDGDTIARNTTATSFSPAENRLVTPSPTGTIGMDSPASQASLDHSPTGNLVAGGAAARKSGIATPVPAAIRPFVPARTEAIELRAKIVRLEAQVKKERTKSEEMAKRARYSSEYADSLLKDLHDAEKHEARLHAQHRADEMELNHVEEHCERLQNKLQEANAEAAVEKQRAEKSEKTVQILEKKAQTLERRLVNVEKQIVAMQSQMKGSKAASWARVLKSRLGVAIGSGMLWSAATTAVFYLAHQKRMAAAA